MVWGACLHQMNTRLLLLLTGFVRADTCFVNRANNFSHFISHRFLEIITSYQSNYSQSCYLFHRKWFVRAHTCAGVSRENTRWVTSLMFRCRRVFTPGDSDATSPTTPLLFTNMVIGLLSPKNNLVNIANGFVRHESAEVKGASLPPLLLFTCCRLRWKFTHRLRVI